MASSILPEISNESLQCPVCLDKYGSYLLTECGHTLCDTCIIKINEQSGIIKCPLCREIVKNKPILVQVFAGTLSSDEKLRITEKFNQLFPVNQNQSIPVQNQIQHSVNNLELVENAKKEFEFYYPTIEGISWEGIPNIINSNQTYATDNISSLRRIVLINQKFALSGSARNQWFFSPFLSSPIIFKDTFRIIDRDCNRVDNVSRHRRIILVMTNLQTNFVKTMANRVIEEVNRAFSSQLVIPNIFQYSYYNDIINRCGFTNTLCVHSGNWNIQSTFGYNTVYSKELVIACRGIWFNENNYGFRFHIMNT